MTPFQRKVLLTLQNLQGNRKFHCGVPVKDIESYIVQNYKVDGDTHTQIKIALKQLIIYGTVRKMDDLYKLIGPFANISLIPSVCKERIREMCRLEDIFPTVWDYCHKSTCVCTCTKNKLCSQCNKFSNGNNDNPSSSCRCEKPTTFPKCSCTSSKSACRCKPNPANSNASMTNSKQDNLCDNKEMAYHTVARAISYGLNQGVISKCGKYFSLKNDRINCRKNRKCKRRKNINCRRRRRLSV